MDRVDFETRSRMLSSIRHRDTGIELIVRRMLHRAGLRFRLNENKLPGRPDIVLPKQGAVVFVHGCFWHQHPDCRRSVRPVANAKFWAAKLDANIDRDMRITHKLCDSGWRVFVVWECEIEESSLLQLAIRIRDAVPGDHRLRYTRRTML